MKKKYEKTQMEERKKGEKEGKEEQRKEWIKTHVVREADHVHGVDQVFKLLVQHTQVVADPLCTVTHVPERAARQDSQRDPIPKRHFPTLN